MNIYKKNSISQWKKYFIFEHFFTLQNKQISAFTSVEMTYLIVRCIPFHWIVFLFPVSNLPCLKFNNVVQFTSWLIERKRIEFTSKNCLPVIFVHFPRCWTNKRRRTLKQKCMELMFARAELFESRLMLAMINAMIVCNDANLLLSIFVVVLVYIKKQRMTSLKFARNIFKCMGSKMSGNWWEMVCLSNSATLFWYILCIVKVADYYMHNVF